MSEFTDIAFPLAGCQALHIALFEHTERLAELP